MLSVYYQQAISRKFHKLTWIKLDILEYPSKVELGFPRNSNVTFPAGLVQKIKVKKSIFRFPEPIFHCLFTNVYINNIS